MIFSRARNRRVNFRLRVLSPGAVSTGVVVGYLDNHVMDLLRLALENVEKIFANDERHDSKLMISTGNNVGRAKFDKTREMLITYLETGFL